MANRLLRSFAVTIGAGLATGRSLTSRSRQPVRSVPKFSPILSRIEDIENRVTRFELAPRPRVGPSNEEIAALGTLVSSQSEDIAGLRDAMLRIEQRNTQQAEAFGHKVALVEQQLPAHIEASVNAKMVELEQRLRGEFQEIHDKTVDAFVTTIESRVVSRITALETSLVEQSQSIVSLREKTFKTDDNLQRLLVAVERLCARAEAQVHIPVVAPDLVLNGHPPVEKATESFESHLQRAMAREVETAREPEPEPVPAGESHISPPARRAMTTIGVAILGLAVLGFRFLK